MKQWQQLIVAMVVMLSMDGLSEAGNVQIDDGYALTVITDKTVTSSATLISAGNGNRAALNCTNNDASVNVRWGGSTVTATTGQRIPASRTAEIRNTGAIYMISEGASVTVSCTEETR